MKIPEQLKNLKFCRIKRGTKKPFEKDWTNKPYTYEEILKFENENYGILCGREDLAVIDCDEEALSVAVKGILPKTFMVKTGGGGFHYYYIVPGLKQKIILETEDKVHLGEVQSTGTQVVGPGSIHPSGIKYRALNNEEITTIQLEDLYSVIKPFMKELRRSEEAALAEVKGDSEIDNLSVADIWGTTGMKKKGSEYFGEHPTHGSDGGMNFWINPSRNSWHCFRCDSGGGPLSAIAVKEGIIDCSDAQRGSLRGAKAKEAIKIAQEKHGLVKKKEKVVSNLAKVIPFFTGKRNLAEQFIKIQPLFYDANKMWWVWDKQEFCWKMLDEVDILNSMSKYSAADTINSKEKTEIIEALKQVARLNKPKEILPTWIQFRDTIVDIKTGNEFKASPKYFATNPIPWNLHKERFVKTPNMDRIFEEWVGKDYVKTLYEILAYCLMPDYPIHRLFCFIGEGLNGKSKFLKLLANFIGEDNVTSTELDTLLTSRFEITRLHKKLVCVMGETNFSEINQTSIIKKLTGQDIIGFEYKNKNPFDGSNYAKVLLATNNLPTTTDKTVGFYRRWCIIDFPNRFSEEKDILNDIPKEEYEILAVKSLGVLKDLMDKRNFHNEGSIEQREKKYEEKSNPLEKFMKEMTDDSDPDGYIQKWEFKKVLDDWLKENRFRAMSDRTISKRMKEHAIEDSRTYVPWWEGNYESKKLMRVWLGVKWKEKQQKV